MRFSRAMDWWRKLGTRNFTIELESLAFKGVKGLGTGEIQFSSGLTVIVGPNGAGKSTILDTLYRALQPDHPPQTLAAKARFTNSELEVRIKQGNNSTSYTTKFDKDCLPSTSPLPNIATQILNPAADSSRLAEICKKIQSMEELLEPLSPKEDKDKELRVISQLVGKDYIKREVFEIEDLELDLTDSTPSFPYFRVEINGARYGSESMGHGELALHLLEWSLRRISPNSVLLIEEPEAHVAPRSQVALMDFIVQRSIETGANVVVVTHSPSIIERVPQENARLLFRETVDSRVLPKPSSARMYTTLGLELRPQGVILLEDRAAREFAHALFSSIAPHFLQSVELRTAGSDSELLTNLIYFPEGARWLGIVGLFDGDMRNKVPVDIEERKKKNKPLPKWPFVFLPGEVAPETLLREAATGKADLLAGHLRREVDDVRLALSNMQGWDHHDWLGALASAMGISYESLMRALVQVWIEQDGRREIAREMVDSIINHISKQVD